MQTGQHMGKILISIPEDHSQMAITHAEPLLCLAPDASYLLVGGLGGLGMPIARWMVERGAKNLVFLSRSAGTTGKSTDFICELEAMGCTAKIVTGDVTHPGDIQLAISMCPSRLAGIIQMAMEIKVRPFLLT